MSTIPPTDSKTATRLPSTDPLDAYHADSANSTSTKYPAEPTVDEFQTTGAGFQGDKSNDFAGATGGTDAFSETPNSKSIDEFENDPSGAGEKRGGMQKLKEKLHLGSSS